MSSATTFTTRATSHLAGKYLTVGLADEAYAISVLKVREIIRLQPITAVPQLPSSIRGVINLRGRVIPIVDLRTHFGLVAETTSRTCIVVVQLVVAARPLPLGLIVDRVEDVAQIGAGEIEGPPDFGAAVPAGYLLGIAKVKGQVKLLLDLERVFTSEADRAIVRQVAGQELA